MSGLQAQESTPIEVSSEADRQKRLLLKKQPRHEFLSTRKGAAAKKVAALFSMAFAEDGKEADCVPGLPRLVVVEKNEGLPLSGSVEGLKTKSFTGKLDIRHQGEGAPVATSHTAPPSGKSTIMHLRDGSILIITKRKSVSDSARAQVSPHAALDGSSEGGIDLDTLECFPMPQNYNYLLVKGGSRERLQVYQRVPLALLMTDSQPADRPAVTSPPHGYNK